MAKLLILKVEAQLPLMKDLIFYNFLSIHIIEIHLKMINLNKES